MKVSKFFYALFSVLFGLAGAAAAGFAVYLSFANMNAEPVLKTEPEAAHSQVVDMMDAFCEGDYVTAQSKFYGSTDLGVDREAADEVGTLIWDAFQESMTYELVGEMYATDSGVAQNIRITTMDISSITSALQDSAKTLLEERVLEAEDLDEVYDENYEYKDEFVMSVLCEAAEQAIENDSRTVETEVTLNLVWADGQWWIVSNETLLKAVSGGIV